MKFNFRKIASVLSSAVMVSSTVALAAAATTYPDPFIKGGQADVAVVFGSAPGAQLDLAAVVDVTKDLQYQLATQTAKTIGGSTTISTTGETAALFEGSSKIYANDSLNEVKTTLTKSNLATVLKDESLSGNADATITQTLVLGSNPQISFAKQPTSSDDPDFGLAISTSTTTYTYNATATFSKAINFTHADTKGADFKLFGQKFTVASSTTNTDLVLLKTAEKVLLSSDSPTSEVTIGGKKYTVELVSASDTSATVKVTNEAGDSETKEVNENASKKINGVTVAITNADETNLKLSASVIAGAEKVTLTDGSAVSTGEDNKVLDGTIVRFNNGTAPTTGAVTKIVVSVAAANSDKDAIKPGQSFVDPVFGSFKIDFSAGLFNPMNGSAREDIKIYPNGDDKMYVKFSDYRGKEAIVNWAKNMSTAGSGSATGNNAILLTPNNDGNNITVIEKRASFRNDYIVVGNEDSGALVKVSRVSNSSSSTAGDDKVEFTDVFSGDIYSTSITSEGTGTVVIAGKQYTVFYYGASTASEDARNVTLDHPDSGAAGALVVYPTIKTSKGAKLAFYAPLNITLDNIDEKGQDATLLRLPDGDGYTDVTIALIATGANDAINVTFGTTTTTLNSSDTLSITGAIGKLTYNLTYSGVNRTVLYLQSPAGGPIINPAIVVFEEKDDRSTYEALVTTLEPGATSDDGLGVNAVIRTWVPSGTISGSDTATWYDTLASNSKLAKKADYFGTIATIDTSDSDQSVATLSYPDEQVFAQLYFAANSAEISGGSSSSGGGTVTPLGSVSVADSEVASVSGKNLIVVGGSCVNTVAASLLGETFPLCGSNWESKTSVGSGSFLVQTFDRSGGKVATLVAGYNAGDTSAGVTKLISEPSKFDLTAGKKFVGTGQDVAMVEVTAAASETAA